MVTEISGASIASQVQSAIKTTEAAAKPAVNSVSAPATADVSKPAELDLKFDLEVVERAAATVASFIESVSTSVRVAFDEQIDTPIFTVVDSETSEVIRQIPSEDLVAIARFLESHDVDPVGSKALAGVLISAEG
jgi:flagellar protein FlaG